ncbi:MAG TPA: potassium channel family protein [Microlunatus sp.]|nr:potassium channel family protein [Microlunatus sp.]
MARRLGDLPRREQLAHIARAVLRVILVWAALILAYNLLPLDDISGQHPFVLVAAVLLVFTAVFVWSTLRVLKADLPQLRAVEAVGFNIPFFLTLFAIVYLVIDHTMPFSFSERLDHVAALYFTITVFATVGFGDITPVTSTARMVVSAQMVLNLVVLGVVVKILLGAARRGIQTRGTAGAVNLESSDDE